MPHFRQDPITGQWVSVAPERARRPLDFEDALSSASQGDCPFCEGCEDQTPEEVLALRPGGGPANSPGWKVRVVANKYPFVAGEASAPTGTARGDDFFGTAAAAGVHEVIIESPQHLSRVTELSARQLAAVLAVYRDRLRQLRDEGRCPYALIFKNAGRAAGASLEHVHSQLVTLPMVPQRVLDAIGRAEGFYERTGRSLWEELLQRERASGERVVVETERFIAVCPFASRQPYELRVFPRRWSAHFSELADDALPELSALLRSLVARLETVVAPLAFNWMIHTCPFDRKSDQHYYWQIEVVPRVTPTAGYEWASGYAVNVVRPEDAAQRLRDSDCGTGGDM